LRLFGYEEFALAKSAAVRLMKSWLASLGSLMRPSEDREAEVAVHDPQSAFPEVLNAEPRTLTPRLWDILLRRVRAWNICEVEFSSLHEQGPRRIRWINPAADDESCRWSLSVSLPGHDDALCELRAAAAEPIADKRALADLESLLKAFGTHFAAHVEQFFGPAQALDQPASGDEYAAHQRQAA
jgi:hypothetical protein